MKVKNSIPSSSKIVRLQKSRDVRDREILDRAADRLNEELEDVLVYQAEL